jgi:hypothetical protein
MPLLPKWILLMSGMYIVSAFPTVNQTSQAYIDPVHITVWQNETKALISMMQNEPRPTSAWCQVYFRTTE